MWIEKWFFYFVVEFNEAWISARNACRTFAGSFGHDRNSSANSGQGLTGFCEATSEAEAGSFNNSPCESAFWRAEGDGSNPPLSASLILTNKINWFMRFLWSSLTWFRMTFGIETPMTPTFCTFKKYFCRANRSVAHIHWFYSLPLLACYFSTDWFLLFRGPDRPQFITLAR